MASWCMPQDLINEPITQKGTVAVLRERAGRISRSDVLYALVTGEVSALLLLPVLKNLDVFSALSAFGSGVLMFGGVVLFIGFPLGLATLTLALTLLPFSDKGVTELRRYAIIGVFNTALNAAIFNSLMLVSGISRGPMVTWFALITFAFVITQSFFWNLRWTFRHVPPQNRAKQYGLFLLVTSIVALVNLTIIHFLVNVIGSPAGISPALWANIALLFTIVTAVLGNFFGYKFFVFVR